MKVKEIPEQRPSGGTGTDPCIAVRNWEKDIPAVYEILHKGSIEAEKVAAQTLSDVKNSDEDQLL